MAEGGFYLWKYDELIRRLSEQEFEAFQNVFGITEWGNFEDGANHLRMDREAGWGLRADANIGRALTKLKAAREKRETPPVDDKIVVGYNGLVISALAKAYRVMLSVDEPAALTYLEAAQTAAAQLKQNQFRDGVLWRIGSADPSRQSSTPGMLEDYSYTVQAMIDLYQNDFNPAWLEWAVQLQGLMQQEFGGIGKALSHAPLKHSLLPPFQDFGDHGDLPNPLALSISTGLILSALTGDETHLKNAENLLLAVGDAAIKCAPSHSQYLTALDLYMDSQIATIVTPGDVQEGARAALAAMGTQFLPHVVVCAASEAQKSQQPSAVLHDKDLIDCAATIHVLGSENNLEFSGALVTDADIDSAMSALQNPSELKL